MALPLAMAACGTQSGDPHSNNGAPPPGGTDLRIRDLVDPSKEGHADLVSTTQAVSGAVVIAVDTYDETNDGKGTGTVYVQDLGAKKETPYSGISLFATTFSPGNLAVAPGDVLDLRGQYQENQQIPSKPPVIFPPGALLVQLTQPTATFRFETQVPEPVDIDAAELSDYAKARQWIGMLVRINHVVIPTDPFDAASGRFSIDLSLPKTTACDAPFPRPASLVNDLFDLKSLGLKNGDKIASITGVVGFFCNVKLAPRSAADVQR